MMERPVIRFMDAATGEGVEAPLSRCTLSEIREAFMAIMNATQRKGMIEDVPASADVDGFHVTIDRRLS